MQTTREIIENSCAGMSSNIRRIIGSFTSLSSYQLNWKPVTEVWSAGECISHLVNTNGKYFIIMSKIATNMVSSLQDDFSYSQSFIGKMLAKAVDPQNGKKVKTFKVFTPDQSTVENSVIDDYTSLMKKFIELARSLNGFDLKKLKFSSPVNKFIRLNLGDPLMFIPKHDERHLNQAEQILNQIEFPQVK